jgi:6-phosphogluconolactonase
MNITQHSFTDGHALAAALTERIADDLRTGIAERGAAVLAVSGGSTPKHLFAQLAQARLDWSKVTVTLVDERWVPESSARSNARMVKALLLQDAAAAAQFVSLYNEAASFDEGIAITRARVAALPRPFDAVILGMGDDGHTASFFPGGDHLAEALDLEGREQVLPMHAEGAGEPRITLTLPALLQTRALYLHIEGESKRHLLADARLGLGAAKNYPIRAVLEQPRVPVTVYWCP